MISRLANEYQITGFFYNPNIFPEAEYNKRLTDLNKLADLWQLVLEVGKYEHERFLTLINGWESEPEGGMRCEVCYGLRLNESAIKAREGNHNFLATTLTVGPKKNALVINKIGAEVAAKYGVQFIAHDWKKQNGFKHSVTLSRELGLYRQRYCGCEFSCSQMKHLDFQRAAKAGGIGVNNKLKICLTRDEGVV